MSRWRSFLDSLGTTGGHIFGLMYLITFGAILAVVSEVFQWTGGFKIGEGMGSLALGALMMMYKSSGTNAEQIARAGAPYQPPQPPAAALTPPVVVGEPPLPPSTSHLEEEHS